MLQSGCSQLQLLYGARDSINYDNTMPKQIFDRPNEANFSSVPRFSYHSKYMIFYTKSSQRCLAKVTVQCSKCSGDCTRSKKYNQKKADLLIITNTIFLCTNQLMQNLKIRLFTLNNADEQKVLQMLPPASSSMSPVTDMIFYAYSSVINMYFSTTQGPP